MNSILLLVAGIFILLQVVLFVLQQGKNKEWQSIFTNIMPAKILRVNLPRTAFEQLPLEDLLDRCLSGNLDQISGGHFLEAQTPVALIKPNENLSVSAQSFLNRLNIYLLSIRNFPAHTQRIIDLADEQGEVYEQSANGATYTMTALGLMGALAVIGLHSLIGDFPLLESKSLAISVLPLFTGLLFSLWLKQWANPVAKQTFFSSRNQLVAFVESRILPLTGQDLGAVLQKMQHQLEHFNVTFRKNVADFEQAMGAINKNVVLQGDFLSKLDQLDLEEIANTNIAIFQRLDKIMGEFDKFSGLMEQLNTNSTDAIQLSQQLNQLTESANNVNLNIERVARDVDNKLNLSSEMIRFLRTHFTELDERKAVITRAVMNFDNFMRKSFDQLERHAIERVIAIKDIKIKEEDRLIKALETNRGGLNQLHKLETMVDEIRNTNLLLQELIAKSI